MRKRKRRICEKSNHVFQTFLVSGVFSLLVLAFLLGFPGGAQADALTWQTLAPMPTARYGAATGAIGGKLYVAGGCCLSNSYPYPRFTENEAYDPATNTWTTETPIPLGVYGAATGVINGKLYVAGGGADEVSGGYVTNLQVYDPVTNAWTSEAPMPTAVVAAGAGVIDGKLYVAGGVDSTMAFNTLMVYDPATNAWTTLAPMPTARWLPTAAVINGIFYVIGGYNGYLGGAVYTTVEAYDPSTNTWNTKASTPTARNQAGAGVLDGIAYVVAGSASNAATALATVEAYDPVKDAWTSLAAMPTATVLPGAGVINDILYVVGGEPSGININVLQAATPMAVQVQSPINADGSSVFKATRGVIPVQFTLTEAGVATCTLPNATISLTRTAGGTLGSIDETVYSMAADRSGSGCLNRFPRSISGLRGG